MKRIIALALIVALGCGVLCGCGKKEPYIPSDNSTHDDGWDAPSNTRASSSFNAGQRKRTTIGYRDGRTVEATFQPYLSMRGTGTEMAHPANETVPLPVGGYDDLLIPFEATFENATEGSYSTDINLRMRFAYGQSGSLTDGSIYSFFEYIQCAHGDSLGELKIINNKFGSRENDFSWKQLAPGEYGFIYGCVVVKDFFSPKYPNGILEAWPPLDLESTISKSLLPQNFIEFTFLDSDEGNIYWLMEPVDGELQMLRITQVTR